MTNHQHKAERGSLASLELLAPAGGFDQLRYAVYYGADAVYLGADRFGLRQRATNFSLDTIPEAVQFAHDHGVAVHVTCNTLMSGDDLDTLPEYAHALDEAGIDAAIVSDLGALRIFRKHAPRVEVHVSTQASCANAHSALTWYELGARRIVCAREMSLEDIARMRTQIPDDLEIEAFVHGAMCMAVSGRCLISDYLTGRSGNKGACTQPCRWKYTLQEEFRPDQQFPIEEDEHGSYIMNAKDLNMLAHLSALAQAGVDSIKIEGRNKKAFYVATVVNAYRQVLDGADPADFAPELEKISHRPYGTGFYFGRAEQAPEQSGYLQEYIHVGTVESCTQDTAAADCFDARVRCHNRIALGDELEVVSPHKPIRSFEVSSLSWEKAPDFTEAVDVANRSLEIYHLPCPWQLAEHDLLRMKKKSDKSPDA